MRYVLLAATSACAFSSDGKSCQVTCGENGLCPSSQICLADGFCHREAGEDLCLPDAAPVVDPSGADARASADGSPAGEDAAEGLPDAIGCLATATGMFSAGRCDCGDSTCGARLRRVTAAGNTLAFYNDCDEMGMITLTGATVSGSFQAGRCDCGDETCASHLHSVSAAGNTITFSNSCGVRGDITITGATVAGAFDAGRCECADSTCGSWAYSVRGTEGAIVFGNECDGTGSLVLCPP